MSIAEKKCTVCKKLLPIVCFSPVKNRSQSHKNECKKCMSKMVCDYSKSNRDKINSQRKKHRHKIGISTSIGSGRLLGSIKLSDQEKKERKRISRKTWRHNFRSAGKITTKVIQMVYEDNIKRFGTLTCYLCLKPIEMLKEHLEHKIPLSKGGTNDYKNLGIACSHCNSRKKDKTVEQYLEYLNKKEKN